MHIRGRWLALCSCSCAACVGWASLGGLTGGGACLLSVSLLCVLYLVVKEG